MGSNPCSGSTVGQMLDGAAARYAEREAIVLADERISYAELRRRVDRLARGLRALGIQKDDKAALWPPHRPAWLVAQHACAKIGATVVALNTRYKAHELSYILEQADASALSLTAPL